MTSTAQIDSNRQNAQKSTGPRTTEGKQRSRLNALKHGLRSKEVVLPTESQSEFESHLGAWMDDWQPSTETRRFLVERAASSAWKLRRCARIEQARAAQRTEQAIVEFERDLQRSIDAAVTDLSMRPDRAIRTLLASRRGLNRLLGLWNDMKRALNDPGDWTERDADHDRFCFLLMGCDPDADPEALERIYDASVCLLRFNRPDQVEDCSLPAFDEVEAEAARLMLKAVCRTRMDGLAARRDAMPDGSAEREQWIEIKALEPQPEDEAYQRYEGRLDRECRAAIGLLMRLQKTGLDLLAGSDSDEPAESPAPNEPISAPSTLSVVGEPTRATQPKPNEPIAVPAQGLIARVEPDPKGVFRVVEGVEVLAFSVGIPPSNR